MLHRAMGVSYVVGSRTGPTWATTRRRWPCFLGR